MTAKTGAVGSAQNITWTATDNVGVTSVDLYYSNSGSGGTFNLIALGEANDGIFSWTVPNDPTANAFVRVVAHDAAGNTGEDLTNLDFTITQVTVPLSTPSWTTEGNTKTTDEFQPVSWNPVSGATEYQVWYTNVSTGANPFLLTTTTQTTFTPTRALPIGQYNIWVRSATGQSELCLGPRPCDAGLVPRDTAHAGFPADQSDTNADLGRTQRSHLIWHLVRQHHHRRSAGH